MRQRLSKKELETLLVEVEDGVPGANITLQELLTYQSQSKLHKGFVIVEPAPGVYSVVKEQQYKKELKQAEKAALKVRALCRRGADGAASICHGCVECFGIVQFITRIWC